MHRAEHVTSVELMRQCVNRWQILIPNNLESIISCTQLPARCTDVTYFEARNFNMLIIVSCTCAATELITTKAATSLPANAKGALIKVYAK